MLLWPQDANIYTVLEVTGCVWGARLWLRVDQIWTDWQRFYVGPAGIRGKCWIQ